MSSARVATAGVPRPPLSLTGNSLALVAAKVAGMALGFVFWLLAARLFTRGEVGLAAGVVSAMMLCTQVAQLGVGSSLITHFKAHEPSPGRLIGSAWTLVVAASALAGGLFLALASAVLTQLDVVSGSPGYAVLFLVAAVGGTCGTLLDQISTALRRGDQALARNVLFGASTIAVLVAVVALGHGGSSAIFLPWAVAAVAGCVLGALQLRAVLPGFRPRPALDGELSRRLVRTGIPNHVLTLSERVPGLVLPIVVLELLSAHDNAAWYAAWMMAWVAYIVPIQVGMTTFAEVARDPLRWPELARRGLQTSLAIGSIAALALLIVAEPMLSLLGPGYAADGATPVRLLALAVFPMSLTYAYYAVCRGLGQPQAALGFAWLGVIVSVGAIAFVAQPGGLSAMAATWVSVQTGLGAWAAWRLRRLLSARGTP
jgi:O-antigen/teichoic acid export membrane protein